MSCCCPQAGGIGRCFSRFAGFYRRHYRRRGLEKTQRQMVEGLRAAGIADASLLEIGCGVGYLHQALLKQGASRALGVDLSDRMLEQARTLAAEQGLAQRTEYRLGDFVALAPALDAADITLLDKVVCCYPDAESLLGAALDKTRRVCALTYPRGHLLNRIAVALGAVVMKLARSQFRAYVHDPRMIEARIVARGFRKSYQNQTFVWLTQVYVRQ
ncbi:MAG: methyltransferase domain-containing protein [Gammaproteobacteria bacterium]|nr:methyltransferase domain-containing protein [Gammaproteobacteria bacterium]